MADRFLLGRDEVKSQRRLDKGLGSRVATRESTRRPEGAEPRRG
jgi:hypothetical protein